MDFALTIGGTPVQDPTGVSNVPANSIVSYFLTAMFVIGTILALIYLIVAGFRYLTSGGDAEKIAKARTGILFAVVGLVVIIISAFVVSFVSDLLGFPAFIFTS